MSEHTRSDDLLLDQRIRFFHELINCENQIAFWVYGSDFRLIRTTTDKVVLDTIFSHTGCMDYMQQHFADSDDPIILSSFLALMWAAVKYRPKESEDSIYLVMGPVFNAQVSLGAMREATQRYNVDEEWRKEFVMTLRSLSTVPTTMFFQFSLMLEYAVNRRHIPTSEIAFQHSAEFNDGQTAHFKGGHEKYADRSTTYYFEQKLMENIRTGNTDYSSDFINVRKLSTGLRITTREPINQAILSCTTFISLCTRAAIEGGLSPDTAYTIGDGYIQAVTGCTTITELRTITHRMYDHFVNAVKEKQKGSPYSRQVQSCVDYIRNHVFDEIPLNALASHVGYTDYYLSRKFHEETGIPVKRYIMQEKLKRSAELLRSTNDPVSAIAEKLHFCSSSYFSSRFREQYGVLPQKYREENQKL